MDSGGRTALFWSAISPGVGEMGCLLLAKGADPTITDARGKGEEREREEHVTSPHPPTNPPIHPTPPPKGYTPLMQAATYGRTDLVLALLQDKRVNVDTLPSTDADGRVYYGFSALLQAAYRRRWEVVQLLVEEGNADPSLLNDVGETVLGVARERGAPEEVVEGIEKALEAPGRIRWVQRGRRVGEAWEGVLGRGGGGVWVPAWLQGRVEEAGEKGVSLLDVLPRVEVLGVSGGGGGGGGGGGRGGGGGGGRKRTAAEAGLDVVSSTGNIEEEEEEEEEKEKREEEEKRAAVLAYVLGIDREGGGGGGGGMQEAHWLELCEYMVVRWDPERRRRE